MRRTHSVTWKRPLEAPPRRTYSVLAIARRHPNLFRRMVAWHSR